MSNIQHAGPETESPDLSVENDDSQHENTEMEGPESIKEPTPMGDTNPTIKNH
jgi:hypothetical protein